MKFDRRFLLRGMFQGSAAMIALPLLDCFLDNNGEALAATGAPIPTRFGTFFWGCSLTKQLFLPKQTGFDYDDTPQMAPLKPFKSKFNLLSGFRAYTDDKANYQHWTGTATIATGMAPTYDLPQFDSQTIDQTIADNIARGTRFRSIEIACSGNPHESYSSLGGANLNPPETSPQGLYTRLFGPGFQDPSNGDWKPDPELMMQQSVMSVVSDDRKRLMANVGASDKARLDQYFTSVRDLENTMAVELKRPEIYAAVTMPGMPEDMTVNKSVPVLKLTTPVFAKLMAIGLATNQTHVFNIALTEAANTMFMPGDSRVFHQATHEEPVDEALGYQPITSKYSEYCLECLAEVVSALDGIKEGNGTLLDHSLMLAYTDSAFAKLHTIDGIPMMLFGNANGRLKTGAHIDGGSATVSRAGLTILQAMGMPADHWGTQANMTTKPLTEIMA